jgi:hypothetical protein
MAHALRELGHANVVVLEQAPAVGGKCCTLHYDGRTYELGAAIVTPMYRRVRRLMREYGVQATWRASAAFMSASDGRIAKRQFVPPQVGLRGLVKVGDELRRVLFGELRMQRAQFPRLDGVPTSWSMPFAAWCRENRFETLLEMVRPWATSFGYGFMEDVPAAYILNYLCLFGPSFELHDTGFGGLWERVGKTLDVRVNTRVERVERDAQGVRVTTNRGVFEAQKLVLACPLDQSLSFLDAGDEERALFSKVRTMNYQTIAFDTEGMPPPAYVFLPEHFGKEALGRPMFYYRRFRETGVITFYSFAGVGGLDGAEHEARVLVERLGGRVRKVLARKSWRYFPHVSSSDFAQGFYNRLDALQGKRSTYYVGELLSFSCVETVVAFSEGLARRLNPLQSLVEPRDLPWTGVENDVSRRLRAASR